MGSGGHGPQKTNECHRCGKLGHWARECRSKAKKDQAHIVQEEEASLMVLRVTDVESTIVKALVVASSDGVGAKVVIHEEKVFVQLGKLETNCDAKTWIVDMGAINYMTGSCVAFIDLDMRVRGTVRFGDDSTAEIEGRGEVEFLYKNGELQRFEGVYYIPKLTAIIVCMGQLDEDGSQILIGGGELAIREPGGKFLAKVSQTSSHLYLLTVRLSS
jgi:hypothetical protein